MEKNLKSDMAAGIKQGLYRVYGMSGSLHKYQYHAEVYLRHPVLRLSKQSKNIILIMIYPLTIT